MSQLQVTGEAKVRDIQGPVVANSGVITALDGAASQYVRGDGTLADFPTSTGGGSSVSYYLNSSVSQGTIGGVAYRQLSKTPISGAGTDITASTNGYIASYITDANDPSLLEVPAGNFNCEFYFSVNSNNHNPYVYAELYKYNGTTFTLLGTSQSIPEYLSNGTTLSAYYFAIPVAVAALTITDRLAIRIYANVDGRVVTLHTENNHLCQVVTTFSKGLTTLNNLTRQVQFLATGTSGTNFAIVSSGDTHTFNLPTASATNTGKLSSTDWSTFNGKVPYTGATANVDLGYFNFDAGEISGGAIIAKLNGPASSPFILKSGSSGYVIGDDAISLVSSPTTANTLILASNIGLVTKTAQIGLGSLSATRTFTLPNLSGTLALLEGTQTFTGKKTFSNGVNITGDVILSGGTGYGGGIRYVQGIIQAYGSNETTTEFTDANSIKYYVGQGSTNYKNFVFDVSNVTLNATRTYNLPDASGTIALTSNINYPVTSVFGRTGAVVAASGDYTTTQVTEGTNLYFTNARARAALSFTAGSGAYNSTTGVITIPTNNNQITNGAGYITSSALSDYLPLTGGTLTGPLNGTTATFSGLGTFNQLTMTGATAGRLFYAQTGGVFSQSGNLVWNNTNEMLGVGTPNPSAVVTAFSTNAATQLKAAGTAPAITFSNTLTSASLACVFGLATSNNHFITGTAAGDMAIANQSTSAGAIVFGTGTFEKMRMTAAGTFSIGNTNSTYNLDVTGTGRFTSTLLLGGALSGTSATFSSSVTVGGGNNSGATFAINNGGAEAKQTFAGFSSNVNLTQSYNNSGAVYVTDEYRAASYIYKIGTTEAMRITSGGNVGIGTSSPSATLDIRSAGPQFRVGISGGGYVELSDNQISARNSSNVSSNLFINVTGANTILNRDAGNVLIGTTTNGSGLLQVNGAINNVGSSGLALGGLAGRRRIQWDSGNNEAIVLGDNDGFFPIGASAFNTRSDYRLKEDLKEFDGLSLITNMKVYDFKWKEKEERNYGFMAHELQEIVPYVVTGTKDGMFEDEPQMQGLDYSKIVPILVKAIQELNQKGQEQQAQIEKLSNKIVALESK